MLNKWSKELPQVTAKPQTMRQKTQNLLMSNLEKVRQAMLVGIDPEESLFGKKEVKVAEPANKKRSLV